MTGPTKSLSNVDSWQSSDDDLFAPLPDIIKLGGAGPFVINLSASTMPIAPPSKGLQEEFNSHAYQVQRVEDGRPRYRLRLGPFATEEDADAALPAIRLRYPGALIARADAEDLRTLTKFPAITKVAAAKPAATVAATSVAAPIKADQPSAEAAKVSTSTSLGSATPQTPIVATGVASRPKAAGQPAAVEPPFILSLMPDEAVFASAALAASAGPKKPPRTVAAGATSAPPRAKPAATKAAPASGRSPAAPVRADSAAAAKHSIRVQAPSSGRQSESQPPASVPTTRTVRALTTLELEDDKASRWFVIQLAMAGEAFEPESVPNLDIFSAYRLYSVAGIDQGRIVHVLRLGFFTDEGAARAVASYLTSFYDEPTIRRVSYAEHQRFAEESMAPRKDVGATGKQAVIEITNERFVRASRSVQSPK